MRQTSTASTAGWIGLTTVVFCLGVAGWDPTAGAQTGPKNAGTPRAPAPRGEFAADEKATIELFENAKDSVVFIRTTEEVQDFWSRNIFSVPRGSGSGFIWDDAGHIVTNNHVIRGADSAVVQLADDHKFDATLVGASPAHDIAVLKIRPGDLRLRPIAIGTSSDIKVGQKVFAIGNPFGLDWTLTRGIVSALDRSLSEDRGVTIEHLIQTDAAINPGNSGGPLLDSAGRLIGMNTAIYSPSGASAGIGFAVPVDTVNKVVPQIIRHGKYIRPALGIEIDEDINRRLSRAFGARGVFVLRSVPGSAAAAAGVKGVTIKRNGTIVPGDIITTIEGKSIDSVGRLLSRLDDFKVGDRVKLTILRQGKTIEVEVTLQPG